MVFVVVVVGTRVVAGTVVMPVVVGPCVVPANDVVMVFVVVAGA